MEYISNIAPSLVTTADQLIGTSISIATKLGLVFMILLLLISVFRLAVVQKGMLDSLSPLIRGLILLLIIVHYEEVTGICAQAISSITTSIESPTGLMDSLAKTAANEWLADNLVPANPILKPLQFSFNLPVWIMNAIQEGLTFVVRLLMSLIRSLILTFLYLVGPFALAMSLIPGFRSTGLMWLKTFVGVQFWDFTLAILDNLIYTYNLDYLSRIDTGPGDFLHAMTVNLVIIIMYLMVPRLTSFYIAGNTTPGVWGKLGNVLASMAFFYQTQKSSFLSRQSSANRTSNT